MFIFGILALLSAAVRCLASGHNLTVINHGPNTLPPPEGRAMRDGCQRGGDLMGRQTDMPPVFVQGLV
ncbi:MAG: hypothetical protein ACPH8C_06795 [Candidatus Puniceispirillaceae bacterium]|jgi:hypothetical protein